MSTPTKSESCPDKVTAASLIALQPAGRLGCYSTATLSFRAFYPEMFSGAGCDGSQVPGDGWLDTCGVAGISVVAEKDAAHSMLVHLHPPLNVGTIPKDRWLTITGHVDDPAAQNCRVLDNDGQLAVDPTFIQECRAEFVATGIAPD